MNRSRIGSATWALTRSLLVGLALLWLTGVIGSGFVVKRLIDQHSDEEMQETAAMLMSLVRVSDDLLVTAALLGDTRPKADFANPNEHIAYVVRDANGRALLHSADVDAAVLHASLAEGFADAGGWRILTAKDPANGRFIQLAEPLAERTESLVTTVWWLMLPLAVLLAFAALIVFRASKSLVRNVERTARAMSRQDPQALGMLPLDSVVTEMRPAVEATNHLLARLADALEAERSFTYNSAHELRTPIAGALAQAQVIAAMAEGTPLGSRAEAMVGALARLAQLAERLLALARAEGKEPLVDEWVDLASVVRLTVGEFERSARLRGRSIVSEIAPARVRGDFDAVGLAIRNLLENALVHGAGGSTIRVVCGSTGTESSLAVIDDGPGVPATEIATLVHRFKRGARAAGGGTGLGLSIVDMLARRMGAKLVLRSPAAGQARGFEARLVWPVPRDPGSASQRR